MRRFYLEREEDESGVSGVGRIAEGIEFDSGKCILSWLTPTSSVGVYDNIKAVKAIHGHGGKTKIKWIDEDELKSTEVSDIG